jgi:predicted membrane-bound spermidine synthase
VFEVPQRRDFWAVYRTWRERKGQQWSFVCHVQSFTEAGAVEAARSQMGARGRLVARRIGREGYLRALQMAGFDVEVSR